MDLESKKAFEKYGHFNSTHEVYGVLKEELEEFWDIVKERTIDQSSPYHGDKKERMINELSQVKSVAERAISELTNNKIKFV